MQLIPAIDLLDGRCVRLLHGNFDTCKVYTEATAELAGDYHRQGADWLHVVDLAASRDGTAADTGPLMALLRAAPQSVQTGGGVRSAVDVEARLAAGAARVVIGSLCVTATDRVIDWIAQYGAARIVAAVDVRFDEHGVPRPRIHGWTETTRTDLWQLLDRLRDGGLEHALVTDIDRDGALTGPNSHLYRDLAKRYPGLQVQASGGVSSLEDLAMLTDTGAAAAISGKALLEQRFTVREAVETLA
jgi:phosphoribosylformimino-5-aminoimidazole carboxamide ribotide isomerase